MGLGELRELVGSYYVFFFLKYIEFYVDLG